MLPIYPTVQSCLRDERGLQNAEHFRHGRPSQCAQSFAQAFVINGAHLIENDVRKSMYNGNSFVSSTALKNWRTRATPRKKRYRINVFVHESPIKRRADGHCVSAKVAIDVRADT